MIIKWNFNSNTNETLLVEKSDLWVNLTNINIHILNYAGDRNDEVFKAKNSFDFVITSERTGFTHLYMYRYEPSSSNQKTHSGQESARLIRPLSSGTNWMVEDIIGVDYRNDLIYFSGTFDSVLERHVYSLPMDRKVAVDEQAMLQPVRITQGPGIHNVIMDPSCRYFADSSSDLSYSNRIYVYKLSIDDSNPERKHKSPFPSSHLVLKLQESSSCHSINDPTIANKSMTECNSNGLRSNNRLLKFGLGRAHRVESNDSTATNPPPRLFTLPSSTDSNITLHAALYCPNPKTHGTGPYPLVVSVYGGPHVQRVQRSYTLLCNDMRAQRLRQLGFAVLKCDNRGSSRRGLQFESAIQNKLGFTEVQDQVAAVQAVVDMGIADPTRVGIYGWSYGGYMSALSLCCAPEVFKVAVAGAPVIHWEGYDTHYTERYMDTPSSNKIGYKESSVLKHVPKIRMNQQLMLVHGMIDENVHYRHTALLIEELKRQGKHYDLLLFPDARHSPRKLRDRVYMEQRICDYFVKHLKLANGVLHEKRNSNKNKDSSIRVNTATGIGIERGNGKLYEDSGNKALSDSIPFISPVRHMTGRL